jgi:hypothetical protein
MKNFEEYLNEGIFDRFKKDKTNIQDKEKGDYYGNMQKKRKKEREDINWKDEEKTKEKRKKEREEIRKNEDIKREEQKERVKKLYEKDFIKNKEKIIKSLDDFGISLDDFYNIVKNNFYFKKKLDSFMNNDFMNLLDYVEYDNYEGEHLTYPITINNNILEYFLVNENNIKSGYSLFKIIKKLDYFYLYKYNNSKTGFDNRIRSKNLIPLIQKSVKLVEEEFDEEI